MDKETARSRSVLLLLSFRKFKVNLLWISDGQEERGEAGIEEPGLLNKWSWVFWKTMKIDLKERQMRPERI